MAAGGKEMEIAIKIAGKVENSFKTALGAATKGLSNITKAVGAATAAASAAVGAMGVAAIHTGQEFEGAMSQVAATMLIDKTTAEGQKAFEILENAARDCGASTAFSATEAAEALNYLALAGYEADKAALALPTILNLAGAGAMDLAAASDMVTDSMSALGIEATKKNLTDFSDQLAKTASKANSSVAQLGEAILTVGGTAKGLAGGTVELNTALGILADNGLKGAEGGTHLRNIILSLQSPTDKAAAAIQSLGIDVYDSEGKMRGLNYIFKDLQGAMDGLNNAEKDSILSTLFNKTDLTAANAMLANCTDRFDELSAAVENSAGACEDMYTIQLDNLNGDIDILKSGLSDVGISIYKDLNVPLREMTQLGTSMVGGLAEAYKNGGMEGMAGAVGGCLVEVVDTIADYAPKVASMGIEFLENFISGVTENSETLAGTAADVITIFINGLFTLVPQVILAGIDIVTELAESVTGQLPQLMSSGTQAISNFVGGIIKRLPTIIPTALALVQTFVNSTLQMLPQLIQTGIQLILSLIQGIISNLPQILQMGVSIIKNLVTGIVQTIPILIQSGIQLIINLIQGLLTNYGSIIQAAWEIVGALAGGLIQAIPHLLTAGVKLLGALIEMVVTTDWLQVGIDIIKGIIKGIISTGKSLWNAIKSLFTGGEVDIPDTSSQSAAVVNNYASGITNNTEVVAGAANSMVTNAFSGMDTSEVTNAGTQVGSAFSAGLTNSITSEGFDGVAFGTEMINMGVTGATALNTGLNTGLAGTTINTTGILDITAFNTEMMSAGTNGAIAIRTGIAENTQTVIQAASTLEEEVNTALDSGWIKVSTSAQAALQNLETIVTDKVHVIVNLIKSTFENMIITIPKPKLPVISVSTNSVTYGNGESISVPNLSVSWNASGGIFDRPTIFNTSAGMQGVGENGAEAILPLDTLWAKMEGILNKAIAVSGGSSIIDTFIEKLKGIGSSSGGTKTELVGAGGPIIQYSPVYNLYGSTGKEEIIEADRMSQAEFNRLMKQYERDKERRKL